MANNPGWWLILVILSVVGSVVSTAESYRERRRAWRSWQRWRNRRCTVTAADAAWLTASLHSLDCPVCCRLLANHRAARP